MMRTARGDTDRAVDGAVVAELMSAPRPAASVEGREPRSALACEDDSNLTHGTRQHLPDRGGRMSLSFRPGASCRLTLPSRFLPMIDLKDKVILVTGGSRGIGAAIVRVVVQAGADVVLHYGRQRAAAEAVAASVGTGRCHLIEGDLDQTDAGARVWRSAIEWRGRIDVLVNNAAVALDAGIEDSAAWSEAWQRTFRINVMAVADLCREAILHFQGRGGGTIINIASRAAFRGDDPNMFHYAASKGAIISLTKSIARGYARDGIVAYAVAPGWVQTEMARPAIVARGIEALTRDIPMGALAPPQEVANIVAFLASGLARHATGTTVDINGASYVR
jgi:3-oxoacyl-[acyl-carrier protein] reductase